ncbi:MAG: hypothetical protein JWO73_385 [Candidatus Taylorbacteria bacterium]|nr:hypothetical protein [Candidatus Taylorbacteria bacterium]
MKIRNFYTGAIFGAALFSAAAFLPVDASAAKVQSSASGRVDFTALGGNRMVDFSVRSIGDICELRGSDVVGCAGSGHLTYTDDQKNSYSVEVAYVSGQGNDVWFAGRIFAASNPDWVGNWLFAQVTDNEKRGVGEDMVSGVFSNEVSSRLRVAIHNQTGEGPYAISSGDVKVRNK